MYIREITAKEFNDFKAKSPYNNFHQSLDYAILKSENDYEYEIIGYGDDEKLYAAALVLVKLLNGYIYAYIPDGFIIDYDNPSLLENFINDLKDYYKKEDIIFIKINPNIVCAKINSKTKKVYDEDTKVINRLLNLGFVKVSDDNDDSFSTILPTTNAILDLDTLSIDNFKKNTRNKIKKATRKGLEIEIASQNKIQILDNFVKNMKYTKDFYYNDYYNIFSRNNKIDYFLVSIDYEKFIINSQNAYEQELIKNEMLNHKLQQLPGNRNINKKMSSDKALLSYKNDISIATKNMNNKNKAYIAGALVIKEGNMVSIVISGYDKKYKNFVPNYFLYYEIMKYYQGKYKYIDLNGLTSNFDKDSKYYGLNEFKLGFNPMVYKYVGEYDLILRKKTYNYLAKKGYLKKEFIKK